MSRITYTRMCLARHAIRSFTFVITIVAALFAFAIVASTGV
jgi:hypothetical protein